MKKNIIFALTLLFVSVAVSAQREPDDWMKYERIEDRIEALQIPAGNLSKMTTAELLQACLNFPYSIDMISYGGDQNGFEMMAKEFNGYSELFRRSDIGRVLIKECKSLPGLVDNLRNASEIEKGNLSFKTLLFEFVLLHDGVWAGMGNSLQRELLSSFLVCVDKMRKAPDVFSGIHNMPFNAFTKRVIEKDLNGSMNFSATSADAWTPTTITTPKNSAVITANIFTGTDYSAAEIANLKNLYHNTYPYAHIVGDPTYTYNCHAFAWHLSQGNNNKVWLNYETNNTNSLSKYWSDGSFSTSGSGEYSIVLYSGDHSAVSANSGLYKSKWGAGPLMEHLPDYVPPGYKPSEAKVAYHRNFSLSGPSVICNTGTYTMSGLTNGCSPIWSVIKDNDYSNLYNNFSIQSNSSVIVSKSDNNPLDDGTLICWVYRNGKLIDKLTKKIYIHNGVYSPALYDNEGNLLQEQVPINYPVFVTPNKMMKIISPNLKGMNATYVAENLGSPYYFYLDKDAGVLSFSLRSFQSIIAYITDDNHCNDFTFQIFSNSNISSAINVDVVPDAQNMSINLQAIGDGGWTGPEEIQDWILNIYNSSTGKKVFCQKQMSKTCSVNTSGWTSGIYVVQAYVGEMVLSEKVVVK